MTLAIPMGAEMSAPNAMNDPSLESQVYGVDAMDEEELGKRRRAVEVLYGTTCPLLNDQPDDSQWVSWAQNLWTSQSLSMSGVLHRAERNRLFRDGTQWISAQGMGPWREPSRPKDAVRKVVNFIGPALDWRLQVLTEQRPGARAKPKSTAPRDLRIAESVNLALEYTYDCQRMDRMIREAAYWAQTDGVAFLRTYWDDEAGPSDGETGDVLGDVRSRVYRVEQVRVSPEATANRSPAWWVLREVMPHLEAVKLYGSKVADERGGLSGTSGLGNRYERRGSPVNEIYPGQALPDYAQERVDRFTVFLAPNKRFLPRGLMVVVVGHTVVELGPIPVGVVPMVRITDGSTDPAFFPKAVMDVWIDDQMTLNAAYSKFVENVRRNSGGRLIMKGGQIVSDTLRGGQDSIIEVKAPGSLNDVIQPIQGFSIGNDAEKLIQAASKRLEDLTGYNETARGGMSESASGRAILAIREQLERVFAPSIFAVADAYRDHGKQSIAWMQWGYEVPRMIASLGNGRPDLGREICSEDLDPETELILDPETMFPEPRSLKLYKLDDLFAKGLISGEEYRSRMAFGNTADIQTPDSVQEARAKRICDAIRIGQPVPPMLWQDDESIHQDVLERELILAADTPDDQMMAAQQRWQELSQQQAMKMGGMPPTNAPSGGGAKPPEGVTMPPQIAPTGALPSPVATEPLMQAQPTQSQAARQFEATAPR